MTKQFRAKRQSLTQVSDIQRQIDYMPTMVSVQREGAGDGIHAPKGPRVFVGSFQGLVVLHERLGKNAIDIHEQYGQVSKSVYVLIALSGKDSFGNTIDIRQGDFVSTQASTNFEPIQSVSYLVDQVTDWGFKVEAILERLQ